MACSGESCDPAGVRAISHGLLLLTGTNTSFSDSAFITACCKAVFKDGRPPVALPQIFPCFPQELSAVLPQFLSAVECAGAIDDDDGFYRGDITGGLRPNLL
jgi:hypothetical protein